MRCIDLSIMQYSAFLSKGVSREPTAQPNPRRLRMLIKCHIKARRLFARGFQGWRITECHIFNFFKYPLAKAAKRSNGLPFPRVILCFSTFSQHSTVISLLKNLKCVIASSKILYTFRLHFFLLCFLSFALSGARTKTLPINGKLNAAWFLVVLRVAVTSAKNHKHQRRKRQSVTAKREKSQTPKVLTAILILPNLT